MKTQKLLQFIIVLLLMSGLSGAALAQEGEIPEDILAKLQELDQGGYLPTTSGSLFADAYTEQVVSAQAAARESVFVKTLDEQTGEKTEENAALQDFVLYVEFTWTGPSPDAACGLLLRHQDDKNYRELIVNRRGVLNFYSDVNNRHSLDFWTEGATLELKDGETTSLLVVVTGTDYTVFANDDYLRNFESSYYQEPDIIPSAIGFFAEGEVTCDFDAWLWEVDMSQADPGFEPKRFEEEAEEGEDADAGGAAEGDDAACQAVKIVDMWDTAGGCVPGTKTWDRAITIVVSGGDGASYDIYWNGELMLEGAGVESSFTMTGPAEKKFVIGTVRVESCGNVVSQDYYVNRPEGAEDCAE